jgi:hypothetical protein
LIEALARCNELALMPEHEQLVMAANGDGSQW